MKELESKVVNIFKGIKGQFVSIGEDIVTGIWDGITSSWSWLTDKFETSRKTELLKSQRKKVVAQVQVQVLKARLSIVLLRNHYRVLKVLFNHQ